MITSQATESSPPPEQFTTAGAFQRLVAATGFRCDPNLKDFSASIQPTPGGLLLSWDFEGFEAEDLVFQIERSETLAPGSWQLVAETRENTYGVEFAGGESRTFYRVLGVGLCEDLAAVATP